MPQIYICVLELVLIFSKYGLDLGGQTQYKYDKQVVLIPLSYVITSKPSLKFTLLDEFDEIHVTGGKK